MIKTYDFLLVAKRDKNFRCQIDEAVLSDLESEICTDIHRLIFSPESQTVTIMPKSNVSPSKEKVVPKKITYKALIKMLHGKWDSIEPTDITDL